jgi:hypothetical protein
MDEQVNAQEKLLDLDIAVDMHLVYCCEMYSSRRQVLRVSS